MMAAKNDPNILQKAKKSKRMIKSKQLYNIPFGELIEILEEHEISLEDFEADYNAFIDR
jgi:hypothetical protein